MKASEIINIIKKELESKSISNYFIAKKMKVSQSTVANWLSEKTYPDLPQLISLLEITGKEIKINDFHYGLP